MAKQPKQFDLSDALGRYARGELGAAQIEELTRRVNDDPELRSAWCEYQISRYIDGELTQQEVADLTTRVQEDPALTAAMDEYKALDAELAGLADDVPEIDFIGQREDIISTIERRRIERRARMQRWVLRPALATLAAAAMVLLAFGVFLMVKSQAPKPGETFRVVVLPPEQRPAVTGKVEVKVLPGTADEITSSGGSVVAVTGGEGSPTVAQGMSSYMMFACCAGMPPQPLPAANFSPFFHQAWACVSWLMEKENQAKLAQLKAKLKEM